MSDAAASALPDPIALDTLDEAWTLRGHGRRCAAVLEGSKALRTHLDAMPMASAVRTLPLTSLVYPSRFAFFGAQLSLAPYVPLTHRCLLVQFERDGRRLNLLFNPTDIEASRRAPYFAGLIARFGERASSWLQKRFDPLEDQLRALGVPPGDIDYLAFDHMHTQDLRALMGTADGRRRARFPNATLLCPKAEWDDWDQLHPLQKPWWIVDGKEGVDTSRITLTERDMQLGDGVMLLRTPGHTIGNQTLFVKTDRGVWGVSENGTCADAWSPRASSIAGVAAAAKSTGVEVLMNANTPEYGADQYTSMLLEKALVDRVPHNEEFVQMFPSSEVTPGLIAPGLGPSYQFGRVEHGTVTPRG